MTPAALTRLALTLGLSAGLLLAGCGGARSAAAPQATMINMTETDFAIDPKQQTTRAGEVSFEVHNAGQTEHNLVVEDASHAEVVHIVVVLPGKAAQAEATLKPGKYVIHCSLPGHRTAGMEATLDVQG